MDAVDISSLSKSVLLATFVITFLLGAVMQKTGFCSMGAVSDIFIMSSWGRLKQWFLAIGVAIVGFALMSYFGLIDPLKSMYTGSKFLWLSTIVGSMLFGFGMVLASGCGSKTLVRIGGGNLKSIVVFMVLGLSAYMTMKGFLGVIRINTLDSVFIALNTPQDLPSILSPIAGIARPCPSNPVQGITCPTNIPECRQISNSICCTFTKILGLDCKPLRFIPAHSSISSKCIVLY